MWQEPPSPRVLGTRDANTQGSPKVATATSGGGPTSVPPPPTHTFPDGASYVGEYKDGKLHGQGTFTFPNGASYVGEFDDDKRHGQGTFTFASGAVYKGEWKHGKKHGQGTNTFPNGEVYKGEFKDDKRHGQGKQFDAQGDLVREGKWLDDVFIDDAEALARAPFLADEGSLSKTLGCRVLDDPMEFRPKDPKQSCKHAACKTCVTKLIGGKCDTCSQKKKHQQTPSPRAQYVNQGLPILPAAPVQYPTGLIIVVDTCTLHNIDLDKLNQLVKTNQLVIPAAVVNELDDQNKREGPLRVKAFQLRNWFAEMQCAPVGSVQRSNVRFQSSQGGDTLEVVDDKKPDDRILGCALFFRRSAVAEGKDCVIGTDDNFMAVKGRGGESMAVFKAWQLCHWNDTLQEQVAEAREEHARVEAENRFTEEKLAAEDEKRKMMLRQVAKARSMIAEGQALLNSLLPQWKCVQCQESNNPSNTHCEKCNFNHGPMECHRQHAPAPKADKH